MVMRRSITEQRTAPVRSVNNSCWSTFSAQQHRGVLRIELRSGATWLLPYGYWGLACLEKLEGMEQLTIQFTSHEVRIEGEHLQDVLLELQAGNVEVLRELPEDYRLPTSEVAIHAIFVDRLEWQEGTRE